MSWPSRLLALLLTAGAALPPAAARAQSDGLRDALALEFKSAGDQAMQAKRYEEALRAYERANDIEPHPSLLFNRGRALQALNRYPEALDAMVTFREQASPELAARAGNLDELVTNLQQHVSSLEVICDVPGARAVLDGKPLGSAPFAKPLRVNAGRAHLTVSAEGYSSFERELELPGAETQRVTVVLLRRKAEGHLQVTSVVGAVAFVDGVRLGTVPAELTLQSGRHSLRIEHPGYLAAETGIEVSAGQNRRLHVPLERKTGLLGQWWFWTGAAVLVGAGVTVAILATTERAPSTGDIPPGRVAAPLVRF
jgi:PEGA domain